MMRSMRMKLMFVVMSIFLLGMSSVACAGRVNVQYSGVESWDDDGASFSFTLRPSDGNAYYVQSIKCHITVKDEDTGETLISRNVGYKIDDTLQWSSFSGMARTYEGAFQDPALRRSSPEDFHLQVLGVVYRQVSNW